MDDLIIRELGCCDYQTIVLAMQQFTAERTPETPDEIWFCEHPPVFTMGKFGDASHVLDAGDIPIVWTDRGGQVTYHGPGQLMIYTLINLKRRKISIREWVDRLESLLIQGLQSFGLSGQRRPGRPGVYIGPDKVASLGLRVSRGSTYHGAALNVDMDLSPFNRINPCGYSDQQVIDMATACRSSASKVPSIEEVTEYFKTTCRVFK